MLNYRTESPPSFVVPSQQAKSGVNESTPTIMAAACCASCVLHCMQINLIPFYQCKAARNMADSNQQCTLVIAAGHATARGNYENKMAAVCDTTGGFHYSLPLSIHIHTPTPIHHQLAIRAKSFYKTACMHKSSAARRVQITQHEVITVSVSELFHNFELLMHSECNSEQAIS